MGRLRNWLVGRYLPSWAVQTILEENRRLRSQAEELRREYLPDAAGIYGRPGACTPARYAC